MKSYGYLVATALLLAIVCASPVAGQQDKPDPRQSIVRVHANVPDEARTARVLGTTREGNGVIIDANGLVLTIGYLILEAEKIEVEDRHGELIGASFVGYDHGTGFGLLRTHRPPAGESMALGRSADLQQGDPIMVIAHNGEKAVQGARVLSRGEFTGYWEYLLEEAIYAAPAHPDFGGAALVGRDGQLLGVGSIYTQVAIAGLGKVPCNMFVPIDLLKPILRDMIETGRSRTPPQPWLGVYLEESYGRVIVMRTAPDGPAEQAGLQTGDLILSVNQESVDGLADFYRKLWALGASGVTVPLSVLQGSTIRDVKIRSQDRYKYLQLQPGRGSKKVRLQT